MRIRCPVPLDAKTNLQFISRLSIKMLVKRFTNFFAFTLVYKAFLSPYKNKIKLSEKSTISLNNLTSCVCLQIIASYLGPIHTFNELAEKTYCISSLSWITTQMVFSRLMDNMNCVWMPLFNDILIVASEELVQIPLTLNLVAMKNAYKQTNKMALRTLVRRKWTKMALQFDI